MLLSRFVAAVEDGSAFAGLLDCLVINDCLTRGQHRGVEYDTVRGAFLEGAPAYPRAGFSREAHVQIAVRNLACVLGVFRPNW
jgi:hypothetical protein